MRSRHLVLLLLLFVSLDFAVPYEPTARGWRDYEDEEESVQPAGQRVEPPAPSAERPSTAEARARRPRPSAGRQATRQPEAPVTRLARADTSSPPSASPEAH